MEPTAEKLKRWEWIAKKNAHIPTDEVEQDILDTEVDLKVFMRLGDEKTAQMAREFIDDLKGLLFVRKNQ